MIDKAGEYIVTVHITCMQIHYRQPRLLWINSHFKRNQNTLESQGRDMASTHNTVTTEFLRACSVVPGPSSETGSPSMS